ncbi:MBL fold metallo-hydrolase [Paenibacillus marinisediminis]
MKSFNRRWKGPFVMFMLLLLLLSGCSVAADETKPLDQAGGNTASGSMQAEGELSVHYIDVGQGASQLLIGPTGKTMLIDGGDNSQEDTVVGYLKHMGVSKIDILVGTHPDADHIGGLDKVIDNFDIGKIYMPKIQANTKTYESVLQSIKNKGLKVTTAKAGLVLDWEPGIEVKMIAPVNTYDDPNEMSAVIHLTYGQTKFLFTGDAEIESEKDMLASGQDIQSDVLLVGHHGSKTSTSPQFLNKVDPSYAVIQVGKDNKYGHPEQEVLNRLHEKGIKIYRNDEQGNIVFTTDGNKITAAVNPWNEQAAASGEAESKKADSAAIAPAPKKQETVDGGLTVKAIIDDKTPKQNSSVTVTVTVKDSKGKPVSGADVALNLHYKSKDTPYEGTTNAKGEAALTFEIGKASKGFTVNGDISVTHDGKSSEAQVSFTPQ